MDAIEASLDREGLAFVLASIAAYKVKAWKSKMDRMAEREKAEVLKVGMKRIGIVGGLSAESTADFHHRMIRSYVERFGDTQYPEMIIFSVTFKKFWDLSVRGQWDRFARGIEEALSALAAA